VAHFGLASAGRLRQVQRLAEFIAAEVPAGEPLLVAGDFNDWTEKLDEPMRQAGLARARAPDERPLQAMTFPSRVPIFAHDRVYTRGLRCCSTMVPRGSAWARMSDHLPLVAELEFD